VPRWLGYSLLAIVLWGVWGLIGKMTPTLSPLVMTVLSTIGILPVAAALLLSPGLWRGERIGRGMAFGFATGICGQLGNLSYLEALRRGGQASTVLPLTSLYPLVTVLLARLLLGERLHRVQAGGFVLALGAFVLFGRLGAGPEEAAAAAGSAWMPFALATLVLFGVAAVTQKLAVAHISNELSLVCFAAAFVPIAAAILPVVGSDAWATSTADWLWSLLYGALIGVGTLALFAAYRWGKASVVTAVTGLYPALTVLLAVPLFGEDLTLLKAGAIGLALAAGTALSYEKPPVAPEVVCPGPFRCAEGPIWDPEGRRLLWDDLAADELYARDGAGGAALLERGVKVSAIALNADGALLLAGAAGLLYWRGPGQARVLLERDGDGPLSFNDVIADPRGRLYAGTIYWGETMQKPGKLYLIGRDGGAVVVEEGLLLANGMGFSPDDRTLYVTDSAARRIYAYDVEPVSGALSRRRTLVEVPRTEGLPDGLTVDAEGFVWSAQWYGGQVVRYDPEGRVERRIALPARQVSSVAFGGEALDELFVTTAAEVWRSDLAPPGYDFGADGAGGALYRLRPGVRGRPERWAELSFPASGLPSFRAT
jgi:D-xylonolactonase